MTRSIRFLAQGELVDSLRLHPLGIVLFGGSILGFFGGVMQLTTGRDPFWAYAERRAAWLAGGLVPGADRPVIVRAFIVPEWAPEHVGAEKGSSSGRGPADTTYGARGPIRRCGE